MINIRQKGDFHKTFDFLNRCKDPYNEKKFREFGEKGVAALKSATPVNSGLTSESWCYYIKKTKDSISISFNNSNIVNGVPIAIILQYGHIAKDGSWISGQNYVDPALQELFKEIINSVREEVIG